MRSVKSSQVELRDIRPATHSMIQPDVDPWSVRGNKPVSPNTFNQELTEAKLVVGGTGMPDGLETDSLSNQLFLLKLLRHDHLAGGNLRPSSHHCHL